MFEQNSCGTNNSSAPAVAASPAPTVVTPTPSMLSREDMPGQDAPVMPGGSVPPSAPPVTAPLSNRYLDNGGPSASSAPPHPSASFIETNNGVPPAVSNSSTPPMPADTDEL